jgi:hypothetical protein
VIKEIDLIVNLIYVVMQFLLWIVVGGIVEIIVSYKFFNSKLMTFASIKEQKIINNFGSWVIFILISIISPVGTILRIMNKIYKVFKK